MTDELAAVALRMGQLRLVLGNESGITAMEVAAAGDQTALAFEDLRGAKHWIDLCGRSLFYPEAIFIVDRDAEESPGSGEITVEPYGAEEAFLAALLHELDPAIQKGILAEAAFASWRQRLADAADGLPQLSNAEAGIVGRLDVRGSPLLTELRAERRRAVLNAVVPVEPLDNAETVIRDLIADLRASVRFAAAGLIETSDSLLAEAVQSAGGDGGLVGRLRLLMAAEEILAIELLSSAGQHLSSGMTDKSCSAIFDDLLSDYEAQRQRAEEIGILLGDVIERLPAVPQNPAARLVRRKTVRAAHLLLETADAYASVVSSPVLSDHESTTWDEAARAVVELDGVTAGGPTSGSTSQSVEDAAASLGALFAQQLPAAVILVDDVAHEHPDLDAEERVQVVKRQIVRRLATESRRHDSRQPVQESVAMLAMAIALLRGIAPHTDAEFQELGRRILGNAARIANAHAKAGAVLPAAAAGFGRIAREVQLHIAEYLFHALSGVKPGGAGAARNVYKSARSKVWRARYNKRVTEAAADGMSNALRKAIDAAAPRLIVRYVDRSLPAARR